MCDYKAHKQTFAFSRLICTMKLASNAKMWCIFTFFFFSSFVYYMFFLFIIYLFIFMFWLNYYHNVQHHLLRWYKKLQSLQKNVQLCFIKIWKLTSVWQGFITVIINYAGVEIVHLIENARLCFACCPPSLLLLRTFDMHIHITSLFRILFFLPTK